MKLPKLPLMMTFFRENSRSTESRPLSACAVVAVFIHVPSQGQIMHENSAVSTKMTSTVLKPKWA